MAQTRILESRSLRQGQRSNQDQTMTLHNYTHYPMSLPNINFLHLTVSEIIAQTRFFKFNIIIARSKVKSRSNFEVAHLHPRTNVPTKYELPTPYSFQDMVWTRFLRSRSLQQGQKSNHSLTLIRLLTLL